jgi:1-acyl-sn-glycerol-3-phosphate acyltransferase
MKRWSKGYEALRVYVRFAFWLTHKRIVIVGRENIPKGKPIIFAANHQNALMDPLALVCTNPLQTLWLARADIFKSKMTRPILKFMKMIPIYRIRDGKENLSNNEQVFNQVTQVLEDQQSVALFPEAAHSGKRQMLPHKKAIPRIALEAEAKNNFNLGLVIVPVGIYYDHYWKFNRTLIVQYGKAIEIDGFKDQYTENPQNAMLSLRDIIHERLSPLTMQINSDKYYNDYENIRKVGGQEYSKKEVFSKDPILQLFKAEQALIMKIEHLEINNPEIFDQIRNLTNKYDKEIRKAGISDCQIVKGANSSLAKLFIQCIGVLLSLPLFVFGFIFNFIPFYLPRITLTRKVKDPAFLSSFIFAFGLVMFPLSFLIESIVIWVTTGSFQIALVMLLLMPFTGKIAYNLLQFYQDFLKVFKFKFLNPGLLKHFIILRSEINKLIGKNII